MAVLVEPAHGGRAGTRGVVGSPGGAGGHGARRWRGPSDAYSEGPVPGPRLGTACRRPGERHANCPQIPSTALCLSSVLAGRPVHRPVRSTVHKVALQNPLWARQGGTRNHSSASAPRTDGERLPRGDPTDGDRSSRIGPTGERTARSAGKPDDSRRRREGHHGPGGRSQSPRSRWTGSPDPVAAGRSRSVAAASPSGDR